MAGCGIATNDAARPGMLPCLSALIESVKVAHLGTIAMESL
jgi:hypothetical protein